jgi:ABC-type Zn uptake system ZnuABC Zn-binding protein ZnuA
MRKQASLASAVVLLSCVWLAGCSTPPPAPRQGLRVLAVETFLADIAQNVAGERARVSALIPIGLDPHAYEPTPRDVRAVADSDVLIANGAGFEAFLARLLQTAGGKGALIEASAGLVSRQPGAGEAHDAEHTEGDPHFWLDPHNVAQYVSNIRDGLSAADPPGKASYAANADAYAKKLDDLSEWVTDQIRQVPVEQRLLVTNHESLGYFADRYGFRVIGTLIPSVSTGAAPSAQELSRLTQRMQQLGVKAIFLETGANPQLARQIAQAAGAQVVTELYTHSISAPGGPAPTYIDMIRYNTRAIVEALR